MYSVPVMILEVKMKITRVHFFFLSVRLPKNSTLMRAMVSERGKKHPYTQNGWKYISEQIRTTLEEDNLAMTMKI